MNKNIGNIDRLLRFVIAVVVMAAGAYYKSWWGLVGIVPLLTGTLRICPLYSIIGFSSCGKSGDGKPSCCG